MTNPSESALSGLSDQIGPIQTHTPEQRRSAALTVAERSHDEADARLLLGMLGLDGAR